MVTVGAPIESNYPLHVVDALNIYEYYIDNYYYLPIMKKGQVLYEIDGKYSKDKIEIISNENINRYVSKEITKDNIQYKYEGLEEVSPFTKKGVIGKLVVSLDEEVIREIEVSYDGELKFSGWEFLQYNYVWLTFGILLLIGFIWGIKRLFIK